ncbi:MAG: hypothetical protein AMXMBFR58_15200 [Phycisphaerae bacterium]|nr:hypothetical protein [Phycisphaerales bacterium]
MLSRSSSIVALVAACGIAASASAVVDAKKVIAVGDVLPGTAGLVASSINDPYTDGNGEVYFSGNSDGGNFIWHIDQVIWLNTDAAPGNTLTGAEGTMGAGNAGQFIYSPSIDGNDGVWTHAGRLLADNDNAPNFPGKFNSFNSRPGMSPTGVAYWVAGNSDTSGGSTTQRVFYRVVNAATPVFENVLVGGGTYAGLTLTATGIEFGYDVDDSAQNYVFTVTNTSGSATDRHILKADPAGYTVLAQEGTPVPGGFSGENFTATFRIPSVNVHGDVVLAGDTTASTGVDEILMWNGAIALREGDTVDGYTLGNTATMVSADNCGNVAFIWGGTGLENLYYGQGADLKNTAKLVLATGEEVDFNGDGICDGVVTDFNASATIAPGLDIAEDGMIFVNVDIAPCGGGTSIEMIIGVRASCRADWDKSGFVDIEDFTSFVLEFEAGDADADCSGFTDTDDYDWFVKQFEKGC